MFASCTQNGNTVNINIPISFFGNGATPATIQFMKNSIQNYWSAPDFKVTVTNGPENKIKLVPSNARSYVIGGNKGVWGAKNDPWVAAHEAGHLMGLPDLYKDVNGQSVAFPGTEGTIMSTFFGVVTNAERKALTSTLCGCD